MTVPEQVFLRQSDGAPVGPFAFVALEVLYDARIVDERTPVSLDGNGFRTIGDWPDVLDRLQSVKTQLGRGEDPWPGRLPTVDQLRTMDLQPTDLIGALLAYAGRAATGTLRVEADEGEISIAIKDGKVVAISTDIPELVLSEYLVDAGLVKPRQLVVAEANAPAVGGDLGAALVSQGLLQPHQYYEGLVGWAKRVLGQIAAGNYGEPAFEAGDIETPSVPLGFDRFGLAVQVVREAFDMTFIEQELVPKKRCPLVVSQVEGVELEDCKLQPKELRVLMKINGVRTLADLLSELGGNEEKDHAVMRAVFFSVRAGFAVFGENVAGKRELAEAATLEALHRKWSGLDDFTILGVDEKTSDDEVRARYKDIAKLYHPDTISADAEPRLIEIRRKLFALVTSVFERQESEDDRYRYRHELEHGGVKTDDDPGKVVMAQQAEYAFKKAEILVKVRKYEEALEQIEEAIRLMPKETEFKIQREYIAFLLESRTGDIERIALKSIRKVLNLLKDDANIAYGYLVLGHLNKAANKQEVALRNFERVLEYDPANHIARQEVRLGNFRKDRKPKKKSWF